MEQTDENGADRETLIRQMIEGQFKPRARHRIQTPGGMGS